MATITAAGGALDVNGIVSQLMQIEREPLKKIAQKQEGVNTKLSAWGTVQSALSELQTAAEKLTKNDTWRKTSATSSSDTHVAVTGGATSGGATGSHSLVVKQLAQSQAVATRALASDVKFGAGTISIQMGSTDETGTAFQADGTRNAVNITVADGATLTDIRDAINRSSAGINASIVTDANGSRLMMTSRETGAKNAFQLTSSGGANLDAFSISAQGAGNGSVRTQIARDAKVDLNGLEATSATNKISDMIEGVTLDLKKADPAPVTVHVANDKEALKEDMQAFIDAYNKVNSLINDQTKYIPGSKTAGTLQGNATVVRVQQQLRGLMRAQLGDDDSSLTKAGFQLARDGSLSISSAKLDDLINNPDRMRRIFAGNEQMGATRATATTGTTGSSAAGGGTPGAASAAGSAGTAAGAAAGAAASSATGGIARQLDDLLDRFLGSGGAVTSATAALRRQLEAYEDQTERLNTKLERTEERLMKQYSTLDKNLTGITNSFSSIAALLG
ncbi:MAG: flagellar filament capping protein FliD [Lautropia sp.]|nr:flagellar filament capping protein FliD [Lautropia sp.]